MPIGFVSLGLVIHTEDDVYINPDDIVVELDEVEDIYQDLV
jgi:hypothetical protein